MLVVVSICDVRNGSKNDSFRIGSETGQDGVCHVQYFIRQFFASMSLRCETQLRLAMIGKSFGNLYPAIYLGKTKHEQDIN